MLGMTFSDNGTQMQHKGGRLVSLQGIDALRQSLRLLLLTRPGERAMRPDFGCPLHELCFEPNDATTAGLAIRMVADSVAQHVPNAEILALDAGPDPRNDAMLRILLHVRDRQSGETGEMSLDVDLTGEDAG